MVFFFLYFFSPDYPFQGESGAVYTQIGNAVPCNFAYALARAAAAIVLGRSGSADAVPNLREWLTTVDKPYDYASAGGVALASADRP